MQRLEWQKGGAVQALRHNIHRQQRGEGAWGKGPLILTKVTITN